MQAVSSVWISKPGLFRQSSPKYLCMILDMWGCSLRILPINLFSKGGFLAENDVIPPLTVHLSLTHLATALAAFFPFNKAFPSKIKILRYVLTIFASNFTTVPV